MKRNVVKAMSVGLSAITIAGSLNLTALADETDATSQESTEASSESSDASEASQEAGETQESVTPVTDYVREVAEEIATAAEAQPEAADNTADDVEPVSDAGVPSEEADQAAPQEEEVPTVDGYMQEASDALNNLANETEVVEKANDEVVKAEGAAQAAEEKAAGSANDADAAATKALDSATQEDIDAAGTAITTAQTDLQAAETAFQAAETKLQTAKKELVKLFEANGIKDVKDEDLDILLQALNGEDVSSDLLDTLDGNTKKAVVAAANALALAKTEAETAASDKAAAEQELTRLVGEDLLTKIALQKETVSSEACTDEDVAELARLTYEYYLSQNVKGFVQGSLTLTLVTKDADGKDLKEAEYYYQASYKVKGVDEDGNDVETVKDATINYFVDENKDIAVVEKIITEGVVDETKIITPATEGQAAVPESWKTADGSKEYTSTETTHTVAIDENDASKGFYAIDTSKKPVNVGATDSVETVNKGNVTTSYAATGEANAPTYAYEAYTVTDGYEQKTGATDEEASEPWNLYKRVKELTNEGYTVSVTYHYWLFDDVTKEYNKNNWFDDAVAFGHWLLTFGNFENYTISTNTIDDTTKPITHDEDGVWETVTQDYVKTVTTTTNHSFDTKDNMVDDEATANALLEAKKQELINAGYKNVSGEVKPSRFLFWVDYYYVISYDEVTTTTSTETKVISKKQYAADKYTVHTEAKDAVAPTDAVYGTKTTYVDGTTNLQTASGINTTAAKENYEATKAVAEDQDTVDAKNAKVTVIAGNVESVIDAIKKVITLNSDYTLKQNSLATIRDIVNGASDNYTAAVEKKAANDAANNNENQNGTTGETGGTAGGTTEGTTGGTTGEVTTGDASSDDSSDDSSSTSTTATTTAVAAAIADEQVPLAGPVANNANALNTTNTVNRARRNANVNAEADADANANAEGEDTTTIADDATPLAGDTVKPEKEESKETKTIKDEETAKAGEKKNILADAWWAWILLVIAAVAGVTTYAKKKMKKDK